MMHGIDAIQYNGTKKNTYMQSNDENGNKFRNPKDRYWYVIVSCFEYLISWTNQLSNSSWEEFVVGEWVMYTVHRNISCYVIWCTVTCSNAEKNRLLELKSGLNLRSSGGGG